MSSIDEIAAAIDEMQATGSRRHRTAQEMVVEELRSQILSGKRLPGSRIVQGELAEQLHVSTTPVREALRALAELGLVDLKPRHDVRVHNPTEKEIVEFYEIRLALEPLAIMKASQNATDEELARARAVLEVMDLERDPVRWALLSRAFHGILDEAAKSPHLAKYLASLRDRSVHYTAVHLRSMPHRIPVSNSDHRDLIEACVARDVEMAVEVITRHVRAWSAPSQGLERRFGKTS